MAPLSENRVRMLAGAMLGALVLVYCINVLAGRGRVDARGDIIGCDFLAFYGAGLDVRAGRTHLLYDLEHQRRIQQPIARNPEWKYYYPFVNPPFYAAWVSPFAALPYGPAVLAWALTTLAAMLFSVGLLGRSLGFNRRTTLTAMLVALAFPAAFMNLGGGQNAAFSLLLLTLCVVLQMRSRDLLAGLVLGLLLYKPQLVITIAALWVVKGRGRSLAGLALVGLALAVESFVFMPDASHAYVGISAKLGTLIHQGSYETWKQNSWYGFFTLAMYPHWPTLLRVLTVLACGLTFGLLICAWRGPWRPDGRAFKLQMAAAIVASLLISPHLYMYDLTILILPGVLLADHALRVGQRNPLSPMLIWPSLLFFGLPVWLQIARLTSVQVGPFLMLGMLAMLLRLTSTSTARAARPSSSPTATPITEAPTA